MSVGVTKDYKLKVRILHASHTLGWSWNWNTLDLSIEEVSGPTFRTPKQTVQFLLLSKQKKGTKTVNRTNLPFSSRKMEQIISVQPYSGSQKVDCSYSFLILQSILVLLCLEDKEGNDISYFCFCFRGLQRPSRSWVGSNRPIADDEGLDEDIQ
jgi:hypothetical protein